MGFDIWVIHGSDWLMISLADIPLLVVSNDRTGIKDLQAPGIYARY
jgi:hypothetical protein